MATRRQFSREFKVEAVKLVTERGVGVSQAERDLDVGETVLRRCDVPPVSVALGFGVRS